MRILVIGCGNPLAGDDGAGPVAARCLVGRPGVEVKICHQLTPELAADLAWADRVVFIDAALGGRGVRVRTLDGITGGSPLSHVMTPEAVLRLARAIYGRVAPAILVTIPGRRFALGDRLSSYARRRVAAAVRTVEGLVRRSGPG